LIEYRALWEGCRALLIQYSDIWIEYRALLIELRALLEEYRAFLEEHGVPSATRRSTRLPPTSFG